jgi:cytochrome c-type biogenesis protein CcmE
MKVKWTVGLIIVAGAIALFFLSSTGNSKPVLYYSPQEFHAAPSKRVERVKLKGLIQPGSVKMSQNHLDVWFHVQDEKDPAQTVPVHYQGAVPDAFQEGLQIVVDGRMDGSGTFQGRELIVKCPSKYESNKLQPKGEKPDDKGPSPKAGDKGSNE